MVGVTLVVKMAKYSFPWGTANLLP